jgi:hypothetical protein
MEELEIAIRKSTKNIEWKFVKEWRVDNLMGVACIGSYQGTTYCYKAVVQIPYPTYEADIIIKAVVERIAFRYFIEENNTLGIKDILDTS